MNDGIQTRPTRGDTEDNGQIAASPSGGAAAVSTPVPTHEAAQEEVAPERKVKTLEYRELTLTLPEDLPATVAFDYAEIEDGKKSVSPVFNLIKSIVGEDQYNDLYQKVRDDGVTMDEVLPEISQLMEDLFAAYGSSAGESPASDAS